MSSYTRLAAPEINRQKKGINLEEVAEVLILNLKTLVEDIIAGVESFLHIFATRIKEW